MAWKFSKKEWWVGADQFLYTLWSPHIPIPPSTSLPVDLIWSWKSRGPPQQGEGGRLIRRLIFPMSLSLLTNLPRAKPRADKDKDMDTMQCENFTKFQLRKDISRKILFTFGHSSLSSHSSFSSLSSLFSLPSLSSFVGAYLRSFSGHFYNHCHFFLSYAQNVVLTSGKRTKLPEAEGGGC